jgi:hypothetical protein
LGDDAPLQPQLAEAFTLGRPILVHTPNLRAGHRMNLRFAIISTATVAWVTLVAGGAAGCNEPTGPRSIANHDVNVKIQAMKVAAERKETRDLPQLVKELESDDPAVRLFAIESLHRITGQDFGYVYYRDRETRQPAVERWKQWLTDQKH